MGGGGLEQGREGEEAGRADQKEAGGETERTLSLLCRHLGSGFDSVEPSCFYFFTHCLIM